MQARLAVFRADASPAIGTGHVVRCRTLAGALADRGWVTVLATRDLPPALVKGWPGGEAMVMQLASDSTLVQEPSAIHERVAHGASLVVGDHYGLGAGWFEELRARQPEAVLMAIDDLATTPLPVDLILNQNLGVDGHRYAGGAAPRATTLIGPRYALVRPEFASLRARGRVRDGAVNRILVFISGADTADVTGRASAALSAMDRPFDVVVGAAYRGLAGLRDAIDGVPQGTLHVNTDRMAELADGADLAIGAPSSASWERCALGLPTVLITIAENQVRIGQELDRLGAARSLGWHETVTSTDIEVAVRALLDDRRGVAAMSSAAAAVTDGRGTDRVVAEIERLVSGRMST